MRPAQQTKTDEHAGNEVDWYSRLAALTSLQQADGRLSLYDEYLEDLENVPTLRDPVQTVALTAPSQQLGALIRSIVREELAAIHEQAGGPPATSPARKTTRRKSAKSRSRRKK